MTIAEEQPINASSEAETPAKPSSRGGKKKNIPAGLWVKCPECEAAVYKKALEENLSICPKCDYHFVLGARERCEQMLDTDSFQEVDVYLIPGDPIAFKGLKSYADKLREDQSRTNLLEACITGEGKLNGMPVAFGVTDSRFIMGSMGSVVGEKVTRIAEYALDKKLPLIIVSGSGGGARMYEGALSLMQMAKTSMALNLLQKTKMPFISVLTNPTMGGVMASFAALGDIIVAEPKALIGFAGPRVIEQTIRQKLPADFQTSEFLLEHGMIDMVIPRKDLKGMLSKLLKNLGY